MKIAIVHDWLLSMRGAERCVESMCRVFPSSDIFTLFHDQGSVSKTIEDRRIVTSSLQKIPGWRKNYRSLLPLMPCAVERFDLSTYDVVISSSSCVAKGIIPPRRGTHVSYVYSPMRYIWDLYPQYFLNQRLMPRWRERLAAPVLHGMRMWDTASALRPDMILTVSNYAAKRIGNVWGRTAEVLYPPVDVSAIALGEKRSDYFLMVTTFEPNKRVGIVIDAFNELGLPLKVVGGTGRFESHYRTIAKDNIEFLGWLPDETVRRMYGEARALICAGVDDFGIIPVEAVAAGTPVIGYARGGIMESVRPIETSGGSDQSVATGLFFGPDPSELISAVKRFDLMDERIWNRRAMRETVMRFDREVFEREFKAIVESAVSAS